MELRHATAPYFRQREALSSIGLSRLIAAAVLLVPALILYGFRAVLMAGAGVLGAVIVEALWQFVSRREQTLGDLSAVYTGLMCALLLPAGAPLWLPLLAGMFAVGVVRLPFGGLGRSPFSAAAGGYCFAALVGADLIGRYNSAMMDPATQQIFFALPERCFGYAKGSLPLFADITYVSDVSLMLSTQMQLRVGLDPELGFWSMLFGGGMNVMGAGVTAAILLSAVWLLLRGVLAWQSVVTYIAAMAVASLAAPWSGIPWLMTPVYELFAGSALLCAVFLAGDIFTVPHTGSGRAIYGVCAGVLSVIFRRVGSTEGGEVFALLLMNAVASPIDYFVFYCRQRGISIGAYRRKAAAVLKKKFGTNSRFDIDVDELYEELEREKREAKLREKQEKGGFEQ